MWKYKAVSCFLGLYGLIALSLLFFIEITRYVNLIFCSVVYCIIPLYCAFGIWKKKQHAIGLTFIPFILQSIRYVGPDKTIPSISPITVSFPLTSFDQGTGYLIDYLAIFMLFVFIYLLRDNNAKPST